MQDPNRDELLTEHYELARRIACSMYMDTPRGMERDDMISVAMLGLIEAVGRYEPSRGIPFGAYAKHRIRGAILDALRSHAWAPRSVRRSSRHIDQVRNQLSHRLGRQPTDVELAEKLEVGIEELHEMCHTTQTRRIVSIDQPVTEDGSRLVSLLPNDDDVARDVVERENLDVLRKGVEGLPGSERTALKMRYFDGMKLREIGEVMGVSESRVCQLCKKGEDRLRKRIALRQTAAA